MKLTIKDAIMIAVVSLMMFPVIYISMLFVTGRAKLEFVNPAAKKEVSEEVRRQKSSSKLDSMQIVNTESYAAKVRETAEVAKEREALTREQERLNDLISELNSAKQELAAERVRFEQMVEKNDELDMKRIKQLARVYGAMRANEAALILETLDDNLFIKIIKAISDDRQKAKIMAAISKNKASRVSAKMGKKIK